MKSKLYISHKDIKKNTLIVTPENHPASLRKEFKLIKINWINQKPSLSYNIKVRIRHLGKPMTATIKKISGSYICTLKKPIKGLAPGQSAVIYKNQEVLGGGEIRY